MSEWIEIEQFFLRNPPLNPVKPIDLILFLLRNLSNFTIFFELPDELIIIIISFFFMSLFAWYKNTSEYEISLEIAEISSLLEHKLNILGFSDVSCESTLK